MCTSNSLRIQSSKADSNTWESFTRSELKQCIKSQHAQTSSGKEATHIPNIVRSILPAQWSKVLFRWKYISLFTRKSRSQSLERHRVHAAWSPVWSFHSHVICWCRSTVNTDIYQHSMRPSADQRYGDAEFIFQQAPAHTAKGTKACSMTMCYCVWLASTLAWPEARWETPDPTMQDRYQSHLCFITPEQCHRLIVSMPRRTDAVVHPTNHRVHWNKRGYILFLLILCNCIIFRDIQFCVFIICRPQSSKCQEIKAWNISLCVQWIYLIYGFHFFWNEWLKILTFFLIFSCFVDVAVQRQSSHKLVFVWCRTEVKAVWLNGFTWVLKGVQTSN